MARNEILFRELLRLGRSARIYLLRGLPPLAIGLLLLAAVFLEDPQAGIHSFYWLTFVFNIFSFIAMPLLISGILHEEWQANTLSVLFLAETSLAAVLRGILGSRVVLVLANLFACFPLLISVMNFGGVTADQMVQFSTLIVSLTILYGAFAMWGTCLFRRREPSLCFTFACLGLPQIIGLYWFHFGTLATPLPKWLGWIPAVAMLRLTDGALPWSMFGEGGSESDAADPKTLLWGQAGDCLSLNLICLAAAGLFIVLARRQLDRRLVIAPPVSELVREASSKPHEIIVGNPIRWLVLKRFNPLFGVNKYLALTLATLLAAGVEVVDTYVPMPTMRHIAGLLGVVIMIWTFLWACLVSAQTWLEERTERTMELLLATPYTLDEVILWKVDALFWALVIPTAMYSVLMPSLLWQSQVAQPLWMRLFLLLPFTMCCFLYSYVGLFVVVYLTIFFAMKATSAVQAVLSTVGLLGGAVVLNVVSLGSPFLVLALIVDVGILCSFVPLFRRRLRAFELR